MIKVQVHTKLTDKK